MYQESNFPSFLSVLKSRQAVDGAGPTTTCTFAPVESLKIQEQKQFITYLLRISTNRLTPPPNKTDEPHRPNIHLQGQKY